MDKNLQTIEDCLEVVAGLTSTDNFVIDGKTPVQTDLDGGF